MAEEAVYRYGHPIVAISSSRLVGGREWIKHAQPRRVSTNIVPKRKPFPKAAISRFILLSQGYEINRGMRLYLEKVRIVVYTDKGVSRLIG